MFWEADVWLIKGLGDSLVSLWENYLCFIFRHFPRYRFILRSTCGGSGQAAAAQGQFWQMHDILFTHQQELGNGICGSMPII